jgi:hypothetical protein
VFKGRFSPLHLHDFWCVRQVQAEPVEQFGDGPIGTCDDTQAQFARLGALRIAYGQDDIHAAHGGDFLEELAGTVAQTFAAHPHFQGAPQHQTQKTDQDVGFDPFGFLMEDRPQAQVALADAKSIFGLGSTACTRVGR